MNSPLKFTFKTESFPLALIIVAIAVSWLSFPHLPERVISHWNFEGVADGWSSRRFHAVFFPALLAGLYLLLTWAPSIDPKKERYADFAKAYFFIRGAILFVLTAVFLVATLINLGYPLNINRVLPPLVGVLMVVIGNYLGKLKKNWFFGIRTPWTLSSENVWNRTHRLGGWLFILFGIVLFALPYFPAKMLMPLFIAAITVTTVLPFFYSYWLYKKEKRG